MLMSGFADPVISSQSAFRSVMDAFAHPGRIITLTAGAEGPAPLSPGTAAIALTLFDQDTPVWIDAPDAAQAAEWLLFHTAAPIATGPKDCAFAIVTDSGRLPAFDCFNPGSHEYPDQSTTVIVQVESLIQGSAIHLTGPGIKIRESIGPEPLPAGMAGRLALNHSLFPCGIDLIFVSGNDVVALPRSVRAIGAS
jgi:alpha-D-ribose 1-methylphosphonate 5-triphosphate synthase subunit PhnH